jgi:small GTP-binding protein
MTSPGVAAIAVVRLEGHGTLEFLARHFTGRPQPGRPVYGKLLDGQRELDDPIVIWDAHRQCADICTHGGRWVVHSVLDLARRERFEVIEPELPLPDIALDAESPIERDILAALPLARTREGIATLLNQREAWSKVQSEQREFVLDDRSLHWLLYPPRIAIIGVPNAGKSTLANALFGQERSIVADLPGTTRDYVEEYANLRGLPVRLLDTPGLRSTGDTIESAAIGVSLGEIASADLRIILLDPTQPSEAQGQLARAYPDAIQVSGKADVASPMAQLSISAKTGTGLAELERAIHSRFACETLPHNRPCLWTEAQRARFAAGADPFGHSFTIEP